MKHMILIIASLHTKKSEPYGKGSLRQSSHNNELIMGIKF